MPRGVTVKKEREYRELKHRFKKSGPYEGREEEVAARIVNKQRRKYGETEAEKARDRARRSPDRDLPIRNYRHLTVPEVKRRLPALSGAELRRIESYEKKHKNRKALLDALRQPHA